MIQGDLLLILLALPFAGSLLAAASPTNVRHAEAWLSGAVAVAGLGIVAALYPVVAAGGAVRARIEWLPEYGVDVTLRMDGLAWIFMALIMGIGGLVVLYSRYYLSPRDPAPRFYCCLLAFMGAMAGIVLAGNLILLTIFWELTSLFSFLLIGYWHQSTAARDGARMALIVTGGGGLCLLAGMLLLGHVAGSYELDAVLAAGERIRGHHLYLPVLLLVLIGAFTKSAQFPFHFWLPNAMAAPTPVSAYLHSATMVKAGVFLLVRFWPALGGTDEWFWIVTSAGMTTFLLGAFFALFQHDLKGLLAYSTVSHLGLITTLAGLGTPLAIVAAIFHIMNHAVFKASLFMAAGIIDHETGTRDMRRLSGLRHAMPITATLAIVASGAMAGVPLLNGFLSKEMFFAEAFEAGKGSLLDPATTWGALIASSFSVAYSLRFIHQVFFGPPPTDLPREPHEPPRFMRFPVEILVVDLPRRRHRSGDDGRTLSAHGGGLGARARYARLQPHALARHQRAADHERGGARRRHGDLRPAGRPAGAEPRGTAAAAAAQGPADLRAQPRHLLVALAARALPARRHRAAAAAASHPGACSPSARWAGRSGTPACWELRSGRSISIRSSRWSGWPAPPAPSARPGRRSTTASPPWPSSAGQAWSPA